MERSISVVDKGVKVTGAEIGVYNRPDDWRNFNWITPKYGWDNYGLYSAGFYNCANDKDRLTMSFTLYKNGNKVFSRGPENHWWLTGFKKGYASKHTELTMVGKIVMKSPEMAQSFKIKFGNKATATGSTVDFIW